MCGKCERREQRRERDVRSVGDRHVRSSLLMMDGITSFPLLIDVLQTKIINRVFKKNNSH